MGVDDRTDGAINVICCKYLTGLSGTTPQGFLVFL